MIIKEIKTAAAPALQHWADRLLALACHLLAGFLIQKGWNNFAGYFETLPELSLFESTILWICLYY